MSNRVKLAREIAARRRLRFIEVAKAAVKVARVAVRAVTRVAVRAVAVSVNAPTSIKG